MPRKAGNGLYALTKAVLRGRDALARIRENRGLCHAIFDFRAFLSYNNAEVSIQNKGKPSICSSQVPGKTEGMTAAAG